VRSAYLRPEGSQREILVSPHRAQLLIKESSDEEQQEAERINKFASLAMMKRLKALKESQRDFIPS
jgi:hypothetical protein